MSVETDTLERTPPQATDVEQACLGAMLMSKEAIGVAVEILDDGCFYKPEHRNIFVAVKSLYDTNIAVDTVTLCNDLEKRKQLQDIGGRAYIVTLLENVATAANIEHHCRIVLDKATSRQVGIVGGEMVTDSTDPSIDPKELLNDSQRKLFDIAERSVKQNIVKLDEFLTDSFEAVVTPQEITGLETGIRRLDWLTRGFQNAQFIVLGGRPSHGKTAFALNVADYVATREKPTAVAVFSLEMSKQAIGERLLLARARVSAWDSKSETYSAHLTRAVGDLSEAPIWVDDSAILTPLEIKAKARRLKTAENIGLIIIDYLQLVTVTGFDSEYREISYASKSFKALAKELNIPVMVLSQFSRKVEERGGDMRPRNSDLRGSGTIEQDADLILLVYRPHLYPGLKIVPIGESEKQVPSENYAEINVSKQRSGPTERFELFFEPKWTRFENVSKRKDV